MKRKNIFAFVQICLFVQSLCAAQEINFENGTEGESVHFVSGGNIVLSVRCAQNTNNKKRKYLLIEKDKECKQTTTTTVLYEEKNDIVARDHGTYAINKSRTKIAFLDDGCLTVYNLQQKKQEWNKKVECSDEVWPMTFN